MPLRILPKKTEIKFIAQRKIFFILSLLLIAGSFFLFFTKGFNLGIDFAGGILIEAEVDKNQPLSELRETLNQNVEREIQLQTISKNNGKENILIRIGNNTKQELSSEKQSEFILYVKELVNNIYGEVDYQRVDFVGPQIGKELIKKGTIAFALALLGIIVYISIRFEFSFGIGAVVALAHDVILTLGFISLLQIELNITSIAAILTIIGYSINDSVVIYDRIRDNKRKYKSKSLDKILDLSINETLSRTLLTAITTMASLTALVIFGGHIIYGFSMSVLFGVIIGTYSSVYIASPVLLIKSLHMEGEE